MCNWESSLEYLTKKVALTLNCEIGFGSLNKEVAWTPNWESGSKRVTKKVVLNA